MDLQINYEHGSMVVHLKEFLGCRNIGKVRKLVKLIHNSVNPDDVGKIRMFIEQELSEYEPRQKEDNRYVIGFLQKIKFCEGQVRATSLLRDCTKRNSEPWKTYNEAIKAERAELNTLKRQCRMRERAINDREKDKAFYEKCLEIIT